MNAGSTLRVRRASKPDRANALGHGLPGALPEGERLLWQGAPDARSLALRAFHARGVAIYFVLILAWCLVTSLTSGTAPRPLAISLLRLAGLALVPLALIALYSWAVARSTIYSITSRRVVIKFGLALPMTVNLPFARIEGAGLRVHPGRAGDIPLTLAATEKLAYLLMWPHVRPWRMACAEPMLRCISDAPNVASILARALAASAQVAPVPVDHGVEQVPSSKIGQRLVAQAA